MGKDFVSKKIVAFKEYVPGEQAKSIIKLNANENYLPPSPKVKTFLKRYPIERLRLYPDPHALELIQTIKEIYGLKKSVGVVVGNGADEIIRGIFATFFESNTSIKTKQFDTEAVLFSEVTYAGYTPYANLMEVPIRVLPMRDDLTIPLEKISNTKAKVVFITNPNNPTGIYIPAKNIISTVKKNPNKLFVIDEAYVDFNGNDKDSCIRYLPLANPNLLVMKTISKSYSGAGLRLGFGVGSMHLTNSIRKVLDPYNLNMLTLDLAKVILLDRTYFKKTLKQVIALREWLRTELDWRGFKVFPSEANFLFCKPQLHSSLLTSETKLKSTISSESSEAIHNIEATNTRELFTFLKKNKIYIRYFSTPKLNRYVRITVGSRAELDKLLKGIDAFYKSKLKPNKVSSI